MYCASCRKYSLPDRDGDRALAPASCAVCGRSTIGRTWQELAADLGRLRYLLGELAEWNQQALIDDVTRLRLMAPYRAQLRWASAYLREAVVAIGDADDAAKAKAALDGEEANAAESRAPESSTVAPLGEGERALPAALPAPETSAIHAHDTLRSEPSYAPSADGSLESWPFSPPTASHDYQPASPPLPERAPAPVVPSAAGRLVREVRPVLYENFILFLGAFLIFSGSVYFATYFWDRLGTLGPVVAGSLLTVYASGFAGLGYLLQRRYRADLSARVMFGIATAIYPVAATLAGAPLSRGGVTASLLAGIVVLAGAAAAYPAITVAAALFQREISRPFTRAFLILLLAIGFAPLLARVAPRPVGVLALYLAALPIAAMYRRLREVGRVFEPETVIYVVAGSAYLLVAVAVRMALLLWPALTLPEVAPLAVLLAIAAIDLDVEWRVRSRAVRSTLGVVGVLAHATAVVAIVLAFSHPTWRLVTTASVAALFAVTALRHRRAYALHLALALAAASCLMVGFLPALTPPRWVAMSGALLLPWSLALTRLAARWRRNAAPEFAAPVERWVVLTAGAAALSTALPALGLAWRAFPAHALADPLAALIFLPATFATLLLAWTWARRPAYLTCSTLALGAAALVTANASGLDGQWLALPAAALTLVIALAALASSTDDVRRPLQRAALILGVTALALLLLSLERHPLHTFARVLAATTALLGAAALARAAAAASERESRAFAATALALGAAAVAAALAPHLSSTPLLAALTLAFLALDQLDRGVLARSVLEPKARLRLGAAQPLRDAYPLALLHLGLSIFAFPVASLGDGAHAVADPAAALALAAPLDALLIAAALLWIAARHRSPLPTYAAAAFLLAAAFAAPAALSWSMRPTTAVKIAALTLVFLSLALVLASRWSERLRALRTTFLDIPLHLAAVAAPFSFWRFAETLSAWDSHGDGLLLIRRLAQPLALSLLAVYTHNSRVHTYLSAAGLALVPSILVTALAGPVHAPLAAAVAALLLWFGADAIARQPRFTAPLAPPMKLFDAFLLPGDPTARALWRLPLLAVSGFAIAAAFALGLGDLFVRAPDTDLTSAMQLSLALTFALVCGYALLCWHRVTALEVTRRLAAHLAAAAFTCAGLAVARLADLPSLEGARGAVLLAAAFLAVTEIFARVARLAAALAAPAIEHERATAAHRTAGEWAIALALFGVITAAPTLTIEAPLAAILLSTAVLRYRRHRASLPGLTPAASITAMASAGLVVVYALHLVEWHQPASLTFAALALLATVGGVAHHASSWLRDALALREGAPLRYAARWSIVAIALSFASLFEDGPFLAPSWLPDVAALAAIAVAIACLTFAAARSQRRRDGHLAWLAVLLFYTRLRLAPLGPFNELAAVHDAIVLCALAFTFHFAAELLRRTQQLTLERAARAAAAILPLITGALALVAWLDGDPSMSLLRLALLAESFGLLYTLALRSGGHRLFGLLALFLYNLGLSFLWLNSGRRDPLYYTVPAGASVVLVARIYKESLGTTSRRGLHLAGALLVYLSTYYRVVQFDSGSYPLLLGGLTVAGLAAGFFLQLRDLFLLSVGFIALNVISTLAYYGVHRPLLGWTLLTVAGLGLTACGVLFQLRRAELSALVSRVRSSLSRWE